MRNTSLVDWTTEASFLGAPPDPTKGRYLTDAFGDEGAKFVANHANGDDPFFLYMPLSAPHGPFQAKQQDIASLNSTTLTGQLKTIAAQTLAADRAIGNVLDRLEDPNGDGNTSDSVADSTIVVFLNDNGGTASHGNGNLRGLKGSAWEGGLRTPMLIRAPGIAPRQINQMVSAADILPTVVAAAGGSIPSGLDGVNLLPTLETNASGAIHQKFVLARRDQLLGGAEGRF